MEAIGRVYTHVSTWVCASVFVHSNYKSVTSRINVTFLLDQVATEFSVNYSTEPK